MERRGWRAFLGEDGQRLHEARAGASSADRAHSTARAARLWPAAEFGWQSSAVLGRSH